MRCRCRGIPASGAGRNRPVNEDFWIHPPGDTALDRCDDGIALILIAELPKHVIKLATHPGNPGLYGFPLGHERFGETLDGLKEVGKRNRLDDISVATTFADLLFIALHRKSGDCNHRDRLQVFVVL